MAPKCVAQCRKGGKNNGNDAEAICEAVSRPNMLFVPVKSIEHQALLTLQRVIEVRRGAAALSGTASLLLALPTSQRQ